MRNRPPILAALCGAIALTAASAAIGATRSASDGTRPTDARDLERGRYVSRIAGCNDCHTPGYAVTGGRVPESQWLIGDRLGWRGPWGTTYPRNVRMFMAGLTEDQWVRTAKTVQFRPPMPWFILRDMTENDLRALYRYVRSLGPGGDQAPDYLPPEREPTGPVVMFPMPPK